MSGCQSWAAETRWDSMCLQAITSDCTKAGFAASDLDLQTPPDKLPELRSRAKVLLVVLHVTPLHWQAVLVAVLTHSERLEPTVVLKALAKLRRSAPRSPAATRLAVMTGLAASACVTPSDSLQYSLHSIALSSHEAEKVRRGRCAPLTGRQATSAARQRVTRRSPITGLFAAGERDLDRAMHRSSCGHQQSPITHGGDLGRFRENAQYSAASTSCKSWRGGRVTWQHQQAICTEGCQP